MSKARQNLKKRYRQTGDQALLDRMSPETAKTIRPVIIRSGRRAGMSTAALAAQMRAVRSIVDAGRYPESDYMPTDEFVGSTPPSGDASREVKP